MQMITEKEKGGEGERGIFVLGAQTGMDMYYVLSQGLLKLEARNWCHCRSLYSNFQIAWKITNFSTSGMRDFAAKVSQCVKTWTQAKQKRKY